jgi:hypothetical protein
MRATLVKTSWKTNEEVNRGVTDVCEYWSDDR